MPDGVSILVAFGQNFPGLTQLLTAVAYLLGLLAGAAAVLILGRRQRNDPDATLGAVTSRAALCALLLYLPETIQTGNE